MYSYATRGLGFLVRCATISRQLGQGRQRIADKARRLAKKSSAQRLEQMKAYVKQKRAEESEEEREARLHRMSSKQRERLQIETEKSGKPGY